MSVVQLLEKENKNLKEKKNDPANNNSIQQKKCNDVKRV